MLFIKKKPHEGYLSDEKGTIRRYLYLTTVWTTLIIGSFTIDYQLVRFQLRTKLRTRQV